jgi:hypothetical protein
VFSQRMPSCLCGRPPLRPNACRAQVTIREQGLAPTGREAFVFLWEAAPAVEADGFCAQSLSVSTTGAWSLGRSFLRGARSITQALARALSASEIKMWSMRRPRLRRKANSR